MGNPGAVPATAMLPWAQAKVADAAHCRSNLLCAAGRLRVADAAGQLPAAFDAVGFQIHKRRWVIERFFAWIGRNRRFSRDVERLIASAEAFLHAAGAIILLRRRGRC
jgi:transposase